jgi:hypothetical protein
MFKPGIGAVGAFQVSGVPFATSSAANEVSSTPVRVQFPSVTNWIYVKNTDASAGHDLRVGFSANGLTNGKYLILEGGSNAKTFCEMKVKVTELWFLADTANATSFSLVAGLTDIDVYEVPNNWSGSAGVG